MKYAVIALLTLSTSVFAQQCENLIAISKTVRTSVADRSTFDSHAATFCSEYKKSGSSSATRNAGASYKYLALQYGRSSMSAEEVASRVCSASQSESRSADAYRQYVESIAEGAYQAYETCVKFRDSNDLRFDVDTASVLPEKFTIVIGYSQVVQGANVSELAYSASDGVNCKWGDSNARTFSLRAPGSVQVECTRQNPQRNSYARFTRTSGVGGSLTIRWPAYDKSGVPVSTVENINAQLARLDEQLTALAARRPEIEYKEVRADEAYKPKREILGAEKDFVLWVLVGTSEYRHGANAGTARCEILKDSGNWVLYAQPGDMPVGPAGVVQVWCKAAGIRG